MTIRHLLYSKKGSVSENSQVNKRDIHHVNSKLVRTFWRNVLDPTWVRLNSVQADDEDLSPLCKMDTFPSSSHFATHLNQIQCL